MEVTNAQITEAINKAGKAALDVLAAVEILATVPATDARYSLCQDIIDWTNTDVQVLAKTVMGCKKDFKTLVEGLDQAQKDVEAVEVGAGCWHTFVPTGKHVPNDGSPIMRCTKCELRRA